MGTYALPFAISIDEVKSVFGSKDPELLERIKTAELYDNYASQSEDFTDPKYSYNFDQVLEDIIFRYVRPEDRKTKSSLFGLKKSKQGSGLNEEIPHGYGYAMLVICDCLGTNLLPHSDGFYYGRDFKAALSIIQEKGLNLDLIEMFQTHDAFDIPKNTDHPAIKLFTKPEIEHVNEIMSRVEIDESKTSNNEDLDEVQEILKDIRDSFRFCKEKNVEMITFAH